MSVYDLTCGYCLRVLNSARNLESHYTTCREKITYEYEKQIQALKKELEEQKRKNVLLKAKVKRVYPTDTLVPLAPNFYETMTEKLTIEHIKRGANGCVQLAMDSGLGKSVVCTSLERKRFLIKRSDNTIQIDQGGMGMFKDLCVAVKEKSGELLEEFIANVQMDECPTYYRKLNTRCISLVKEIADVAEGRKVKTPLYTSFTRSIGLSTYVKQLK